MKKNAALFLFLLSGLVVFAGGVAAQKNYRVDVTRTEIKAGKTQTGEGLPATEFSFSGYLYDLHFDSIRNQLLVILRETGDKKFKAKGAMALIDLQTNDQKWAQKLEGDRFDYKMAGDNIVLAGYYQSAAYNWTDGKRKWIKSGSFVYINPANNVGISGGGVALDLNTGATKWQTRINNKYGWRDAVNLGDTAVLIAAAGVKKVNLQTGKGWQYEAKTGADDYSVSPGAAAATVAGIGLGLLTGMMFVAVPDGANVVHGLCSNILLDSNLVYFASREDIVCLDLNGKVIWQTDLPKKQTGNSVLWKDHSGLHLLNNAYGYMGNNKVNIGSPYIASLDPVTGKQHYLSELGTFNMVSGTLLKGDTLFIHAINRVYKYNIAYGEKLLAITAVDNKLDKHIQFASDQRNFLKTKDGKYKSLAELYPQDKFLLGEHNLTRVNSQLQYKGLLTDPLWILQKKYAGMNVLKNKNQLVFVKDGKAVAEFEVGNATIYGDLLVDARETKLRIVDLKSLAN